MYICTIMNGATVTTNITFPRDDWKALKIVAMEQGISMAEFVRQEVGRAVRKTAKTLISRRRLTVNGFTPEFEEEVLKAAAEPIDNRWVLKRGDDVGKFFDRMLKHHG